MLRIEHKLRTCPVGLASVLSVLGLLLADIGPLGAQQLVFEPLDSSATVDQESIASDAALPVFQLIGSDARLQLQVMSRAAANNVSDQTRAVSYDISPANIIEVDSSGYVRPLADGRATIEATNANSEASCSCVIVVTGMKAEPQISFNNQVIPVFTKLGCNGGGCHGKASGQAGFKLSLLGFEPQDDYVHLISESRGRRLFPAAADESLLLKKAVNLSSHGGGQRTDMASDEYELMRRWIAMGMPAGPAHERSVDRIELQPSQRFLTPGATQQLRVLVYYSDGSFEDVTRRAQFESNNTLQGTVSASGLVSLSQQPGDVAVMARYQGQVAVFRASVPLGVEVAVWPEPINLVDEWVLQKLKGLGIPTSSECDDYTFIRRATLDITGRLPLEHEIQQFVSDERPDKHALLVDRLLDSPAYGEFFAKKWSAILRNKRDNSGEQFGSYAFYDWLKQSLNGNVPYDQWVSQILTASGSSVNSPPVAWLREVNNTESRVEDAAQLFLGQRLQCARCHHHPFEKWSQKDYFQFAAFFSTVSRKEGPTPEEPMFVSRVARPSARHPKTGEELPPAGLDGPDLDVAPAQDPRQYLADWMSSKDNPFFARTLVNRYWKHFMAVGLVEPEDDMRVTNPATNPELLDSLARQFVESGFDLKQLVREICNSRVYRLSSDAGPNNVSDTSCYSRYYPKRLQAEVILDAIDDVMHTTTDFDGLPKSARAVGLPDTSFSSYFLDVFGKPNSTTACECERMQEATLAQSLHLLNSKQIQAKLTDAQARPAEMAVNSDSISDVVSSLYLSALCRPASDAEIRTAADYVNSKPDRKQAMEDLVWALVNSKEFLFNH
ncbi:MAG: DUF1553 domain-containing protein [Planctomycetales bacterium]|nr:DUF1553 domain-containing protein [Planctomycetales bacterium]